MDGERIDIAGRSWIKEVTEHWPPGTRRNGPSEYSVTFYDPEDPEQWVCNCRIPVGAADLGSEGLREIFRRAESRSWRDPGGTCWRIRAFPTRSGPGSEGDVAGVTHTVAFRRRDGRARDLITREVEVGALRPLGHLTDEELEELLAPPA